MRGYHLHQAYWPLRLLAITPERVTADQPGRQQDKKVMNSFWSYMVSIFGKSSLWLL